MEKSKNTGIGFFEKHLALWVVLCMAVGVPAFLGRFEHVNVTIPIYGIDREKPSDPSCLRGFLL